MRTLRFNELPGMKTFITYQIHMCQYKLRCMIDGRVHCAWVLSQFITTIGGFVCRLSIGNQKALYKNLERSFCLHRKIALIGRIYFLFRRSLNAMSNGWKSGCITKNSSCAKKERQSHKRKSQIEGGQCQRHFTPPMIRHNF